MIEKETTLKPSDYRSARQFAVQFVYQQDINQQFYLNETSLKNFYAQNQVPNSLHEFLKIFLEKVFEAAVDIDQLIEKNLKNWKISRVNKIDLAILRVAVVELRERLETDVPVIISEAAIIAHSFGSLNSPAFVNGVLDSVAKEVRK